MINDKMIKFVIIETLCHLCVCLCQNEVWLYYKFNCSFLRISKKLKSNDGKKKLFMILIWTTHLKVIGTKEIV